MSKVEPVIEESEMEPPVAESEVVDEDDAPDAGVVKAIATYRKLMEVKELSEEEKAELERKIKEIEERDIIETDTDHEPSEIPVEDGSITIGPPVLTRFEKARIMGARALQLSQGAPPFIDVSAEVKTSLDIAMEELEQRIIPIVIKRVLPNGDYQNIPIDHFKQGGYQ